MPPKKWNIQIKLTEKATYCRAKSSEGESYSLSLSPWGSLAASILNEPEESCLQIAQDWGLKEDLLAGYYVYLSDWPGRKRIVTRFDPERSFLFYQGHLNKTEQHYPIQLTSGEPILLMAVRLITRCRLDEVLPSAGIVLSFEFPSHPSVKPLLILASKEFPQAPETSLVRTIIVNESIDKEGRILLALEESEINKVLREVYRYPGARILIRMSNSLINPLHEESLANILHTAGYKEVFTTYRIDQLVRLLAQLDQKVVEQYLHPLIRHQLDTLEQALGPGSSINLILQ